MFWKSKIKENIIEVQQEKMLEHNSIDTDITVNDVVKNIENDAQNMDFMVDNLVDTINSMSKFTEKQMESIDKVKSDISNYSSIAEELFASSDNLKKVSAATSEAVIAGRQSVDNSIEAMSQIKNSVESISVFIKNVQAQCNDIVSAVKVMKEIAEQTKMLSLNASIEAERAGTFGRGFTVVAEQVRSLALKSAEFSEKIEDTIGNINESVLKTVHVVSDGVEKAALGEKAAKDTSNSFKDVINAVDVTNQTLHEIDTAVGRQISNLSEIVKSAEKIDEHSENISTLLQVEIMNMGYTKALNQNVKKKLEILKKLRTVDGNATRPELNVIHNKIWGLDPAFVTDPDTAVFLAHVHEPLLIQENAQDIVPGIAKSWLMKEDNLTWVFKLRQGIKFHNGKELTSEDVKYSLERLVDPRVKSPNDWYMAHIKGYEEFASGKAREITGIKMNGKYEIAITLKYAYSGFLLNIANVCCSIICKDHWETNQIVGCGAFELKDYSEKSCVLESFRNYFGEKAYVDRVNVDFDYSDIDEYVKKYKQHEYDLFAVDKTDSMKYIDEEGLYKDAKTKEVMAIVYGSFNLSRNTLFARNKRVREALNYAVNKDRIIQELCAGKASKSVGVFPPAIIQDNTLRGYDYSKEKAIQILKDEGLYPFPEKLTMLARQDDKEGKTSRFAYYLLEDFKAIGIDCEFVEVPKAEYYESKSVDKADMMVIWWTSDTGDPYNHLEPILNPNGENYTRYKNEELVPVLAKAIKTVDPEQRAQEYKNIQKAILDDVPWVLMVHPQMVFLSSDSLMNVEGNMLGGIRYRDVVKKCQK